MRALVVYESMYGNTHTVAEVIGKVLVDFGEARVVAVHDASQEMLDGIDLLVVGGPTHAHGMSRASTRQAAAEAVTKPDSDLTLDPDAAGDGIREWLESLSSVPARAAAFDTRVDMTPVLTGRASKGIAKKLRQHGLDVVVPPESFLVTKESHLEPGEEDRASDWAQRLAATVIHATSS